MDEQGVPKAVAAEDESTNHRGLLIVGLLVVCYSPHLIIQLLEPLCQEL